MTELPASEARRLGRVARCFDAAGRLQRWPSRRADQLLALWIVWSYLPDGSQFSEPEINAMLRDWHDFEDYVLLRRDLCDLGLLQRTPTGSVYRKASAKMPPEAELLAARLAAMP